VTCARPFRFGFTGGVSSKPEKLLDSALVAVGPLDDVCQTLLDSRKRYGISYFSAPVDARPDLMAPVIAALTGT
jgi:hypothetical protein